LVGHSQDRLQVVLVSGQGISQGITALVTISLAIMVQATIFPVITTDLTELVHKVVKEVKGTWALFAMDVHRMKP